MPHADRPNIVLIFPDQWRADCLSAAGHPVVETPNLDELAAGGAMFTAAYTPCPSCVAARACLITGQTPWTVGRPGYVANVPWRYETTLMRCLRDGGYQTLQAGKTHFYPSRAALGFEEMRLYLVPVEDPITRDDYHPWLAEQTHGAVRDTAVEMSTNGMIVHPWTHPEHLHPNAWTVTAAIDLLDRRDPTRPFFLQVNFHRPHPPLDPPLAYFERYADMPLPPLPIGDWAEPFAVPVTTVDPMFGRWSERIVQRARRAYYAQVAHLDYQIGRLTRYLRQQRWYDNTCIIFSSDHGEMLGDHNHFRKYVGFEGSAHVPLIIRPQAGVPYQRGSRCSLPLSHYDFMPTILDIAGMATPATVEGHSVYPAICGQQTDWPAFVHGEHAPNMQYVSDGQEKFIWVSDVNREYFFDLVHDPQELHNAVADPAYAERVSLWRGRLIKVLAKRPQASLSDGSRLIPGTTPNIRPELLQA